MSESKFTPGKWQLDICEEDDGVESIFIRSQDGINTLAEVVTDYVGEEEAIANAQLMHAATDLLAALKSLEYPDEPGRFCDHAGEPCPRCEAAKAAIAKAQGTQEPA
jgi:hypothetical protein